MSYRTLVLSRSSPPAFLISSPSPATFPPCRAHSQRRRKRGRSPLRMDARSLAPHDLTGGLRGYSEEQFRTMANHLPQLAWMTDEQGKILWYNQRWFDYTG